MQKICFVTLKSLVCWTAMVVAGSAFAAISPAIDPRDPRNPALSASERLDALVERIKIEQAKVKTLEASFVQKQASEFLVSPEESMGRFSYAAPDRVRWEYQAPKPITLVIDGKTMTTWYRDLGRAEEMKIGRYSERVLKYLGATGSIGTLLEYFDVRAAFPTNATSPYRLEMTPRFARIAKRLKSLTLWIDAGTFLPSEIHYQSGDGSVTEYRFTNPTINAALPADRFDLNLPPEVAVKVVDMDRGQ